MRLIHFIFAVCLFTASFDVILTIDVGARLHIAQALAILVCLGAFARVAQQGRLLWPRSATSLALWVLVQAVFLPLSGNLALGVQFFVLLLLMVFIWFAVVQLYGEGDRLRSLMRIYMGSYVFIAACGLVQFLMPLAGLPGVLVMQWWIHGRLARINGFNDEPSFYVTYLITGWIMLVDLRVSDAEIARRQRWKWAAILVTVTLILASSKTGWVVMLIELVARLAPAVWRFLRNLLLQASEGSMKIRLPRARFVVIAVVLVAGLVGGARYAIARINPLMFLAGTGLVGTPSHSYDARTSQAVATISAFKEHPLMGRSLGGVPVYIAAQAGVVVHGMEEVRLYWGFPVLLDVLLASGAIGVIPFLIFLYANTIGMIRMSTRYWPDERAKWLRALGRALIFEWLMLMADQNLLRVYLWFHFAIVAVVAYHLEHSPALLTERAVAVPPQPLGPPSLANPDGPMVPGGRMVPSA